LATETASIDEGILVFNGVEQSSKSIQVNNSDSLNIKLTSSALLNTTVTSNMVVGDLNKFYSITTTDTLLQNIIGAELSTNHQSNAIIIDADNINISVDVGQIILNDEVTGLVNITANQGDSVRINLLSSEVYDTTVSANVFINNLNDTFSVKTKASDYITLQNGDYSSVDSTYYYLTMPEHGNIDFTENGYDSEVTIFDEDMNQLEHFNGSKTLAMTKGVYVVQIYNGAGAQSVTVYSPILDTDNTLHRLTNNTYSNINTTYYYLTMPEQGNIDFTENGYDSEVTIFDEDMNQLEYFDESRTVSLSSATYIVKIFNGAGSQSVTVYSAVISF
jgi:hypothetical protein